MMPRFLTLLLFVLLPCIAHAQQVVRYDVSFPNVAHHEAEIAVTFEGVARDTLEVRMSRTSPGRYALHEFAKNVYNVQAFDGAGNPLRITRPNLHQWNVAGHDGTVRVTYTLFGDRADGTYTGIDDSHAHFNIPATFMWARGMEDVPITVTFEPAEAAWKVATQLYPTDDAYTFTAPDLAYFMDSPTELSNYDLRTWTVASNGRTYEIRLAVHHGGTPEEVDAYAEMAKKVVAEQIAVYGEVPAFDNGSYTFIADYLPHVNGDGMEHRNSTILTSTNPLSTGALQVLGTLSHEFFHAWNVERIRPASLEPFDFEEANVSDALWFAEGFTSYYDDLTIRRAGLYDDDAYAANLSGTLNYVLNAPGRQFYTPVEMSMQAPFVDAATSVDPQNKQNTFISYYSWGSILGLGLDLELRSRHGITLDDYMRALWQQFGKPEIPYTLADLERVLGEVTEDPAFAADFFREYIHGHEVMDYEALLGQAGFLLRRARPDQPWLGASLQDTDDGQVIVASRPVIGSTLYEAGLDVGDVVLTYNGQSAGSAEKVLEHVNTMQPGASVPVYYIQRGRTEHAVLQLKPDPALEVVTYEAAGLPVTNEMQALRASWLASKAR